MASAPAPAATKDFVLVGVSKLAFLRSNWRSASGSGGSLHALSTTASATAAERGVASPLPSDSTAISDLRTGATSEAAARAVSKCHADAVKRPWKQDTIPAAVRSLCPRRSRMAPQWRAAKRS
eukprot:CAMPEP_0115441810 /NCGR_PEP_ID=MMETSP0271-20121206/37024_1 /TAXON_ID=71861 /ORGANISM="Scrippsiella trochoidea, Strain CCMP3099" /LENGTH=122 /DNA_ID=CAMNT_0002867625 /DNA_START=567 /DNA_END=932 /DNA_ORIENTATION=-